MPGPRLPLSTPHRFSCFKNDDQDPNGAKQSSHQNALVFFQHPELQSAQSGERERSEQDHSGHRSDGENRSQHGKAAPSVTDSRNVKRHKAFAGRERKEGEQAQDRRAIRGRMSLAVFIVMMIVTVTVIVFTIVVVMVFVKMFMWIMKMNVALADDLPNQIVQPEQQKRATGDPREPRADRLTQRRTE